jgi:hypothetical protein
MAGRQYNNPNPMNFLREVSILLLLLAPGWAADFAGKIGDSKCQMAKQMKEFPAHASCARLCVKADKRTRYALITDDGKRLILGAKDGDLAAMNQRIDKLVSAGVHRISVSGDVSGDDMAGGDKLLVVERLAPVGR